jgi:hypothetical protein
MFIKRKQIEKEEQLFLGKPYSYWIDIEYKIKAIDVGDLLPHCVLENLELKKENIKLKQENELVKKAFEDFITKEVNQCENQ